MAGTEENFVGKAGDVFDFDITMTCSGCSNAVNNALKKAERDAGLKATYDVSLEKQHAQVVLTDTYEYNTLLERLKKTGKTITSAKINGESKPLNP